MRRIISRQKGQENLKTSMSLITFLDKLCPIPNPLESYEEYTRLVNSDLLDMSLEDLVREKSKLRLRILLDKAPISWLSNRLREVEAALNGR